VHEGGFQVERAGAGTVRFRRPDGALIPEAPARARGDCAALIDRNRSAGVAVDARTCMPRSAGDRLDYGIAVEGLLAQRLAGT
jgi:hypothetical protein